jgi:hypothetical protein
MQRDILKADIARNGGYVGTVLAFLAAEHRGITGEHEASGRCTTTEPSRGPTAMCRRRVGAVRVSLEKIVCGSGEGCDGTWEDHQGQKTQYSKPFHGEAVRKRLSYGVL